MHRVHEKTLSKTERRQLWNEIVSDYLSSGETLQNYSKKHELNYDHLAYYTRSYQQKQPNSVKFVPVDTSSFTPEQKFTLRYGNVTLEAPVTASVTLLCQLIQGLQAC